MSKISSSIITSWVPSLSTRCLFLSLDEEAGSKMEGSGSQKGSRFIHQEESTQYVDVPCFVSQITVNCWQPQRADCISLTAKQQSVPAPSRNALCGGMTQLGEKPFRPFHHLLPPPVRKNTTARAHIGPDSSGSHTEMRRLHTSLSLWKRHKAALSARDFTGLSFQSEIDI